MEARLVAALVAVPLALAACSGSAPTGQDGLFAGAIQELDLSLDGTTPEAQTQAREVCDRVRDGEDLVEVYDDLSQEWDLTTDEARQFTAASLYAYCPAALE